LDAFVAKLNSTGSALIYSTYLGGFGSDRGRGITVEAATGRAYVSGLTSSPNFPLVNAVQPFFAGGNFDAFVVQLNPSGSELLYSSYLGGSEFDNALGMALDSDGLTYVTGITASTDFPTTEGALQRVQIGVADAFVTKLAISMPTAIDNHDANLPTTFELHQNYPNPFNPATTIEFSLPTFAPVTLSIYNTLGQEVRTLLENTPYRAGHHRVRWDARDQHGRPVASGIYLYQIQAGSFVQVKKMLLVR
jgi:hypothetical protein